MILIADSGGSKLDWRLLHENGRVDQANGPGFNPYYMPASHLTKMIEDYLVPKILSPVSKIYFYGAGVSSENNKQIIRNILLGFFPNAQIEINWDLLAAARSLCGHEAGIACILGTGSNSCFFDGKEITYHVPTVGWILGDEGGGVHLGRRLLNDYMREEMPADVRNQFYKEYSLDREQILSKVYQQEKPSNFIAGFSKFILQNIKSPYFYQLAYSSFEEFYRKNVMKYENYSTAKVHFTGSVAYNYSSVLRQVGSDLGISIKNIVEGPIAGLTLYHQQELKNS